MNAIHEIQGSKNCNFFLTLSIFSFIGKSKNGILSLYCYKTNYFFVTASDLEKVLLLVNICMYVFLKDLHNDCMIFILLLVSYQR